MHAFTDNDSTAYIIEHIDDPFYKHDPSFLHILSTHYQKEKDINLILLMYHKSVGKYHYYVYCCLAQHFIRCNAPGKAAYVLQEGILNNCIGKERLQCIREKMGRVTVDRDIIPGHISIFGREWYVNNCLFACYDEEHSFMEMKAVSYLNQERRCTKCKNACRDTENPCETREDQAKHANDENVCRGPGSSCKMRENMFDEVTNCRQLTGNHAGKSSQSNNVIPSVRNVSLIAHSQFVINDCTYIIREVGNDHFLVMCMDKCDEMHTFTSKEYVLIRIDHVIDLKMVRHVIPNDTSYISINNQLYLRYASPEYHTLHESVRVASNDMCVYFVAEIVKIMKLLHSSGLNVRLTYHNVVVIEEKNMLLLKVVDFVMCEQTELGCLCELMSKAGMPASSDLRVIEEMAAKRLRHVNIADEMIEHRLKLMNDMYD